MLRTPRIPLFGALVALLCLTATGVLAYLVPSAQVRDSATLQGFTGLNRPWLQPELDRIAQLADPGSYALIGFSLAGIALLRRRPRIAAAIVSLLLVTGLTSQTLKPLLASPREDGWVGPVEIAAASWPSGHATAAMTLALCAILVAPARARPTVAVLGAGFAISVAYSILTLGWHFPSDILGGFLVAITWTLAAVGLLAWVEQRHPSPVRAAPVLRPLDTVPALALMAGAGLFGAAIWLSRPAAVLEYAAGNSTFVVGAAAIAAVAATIVLGLTRSVRTAS